LNYFHVRYKLFLLVIQESLLNKLKTSYGRIISSFHKFFPTLTNVKMSANRH